MPYDLKNAFRIIFTIFSFILCFYTLGAADASLAPSDQSKGDPTIFAVLGRQGYLYDAPDHGANLTKVCVIKFKDGTPSYTVYWLERVVQTAEQVHGHADFIVISSKRNVLGSFDSDMSERPKCSYGNRMRRSVFLKYTETYRHVTIFLPERLPHWLGGGSGFFSPADRYKDTAQVDGIRIPTPVMTK